MPQTVFGGLRKGLKLVLCAALAGAPIAFASAESRADGTTQDFIQCQWAPFKQAWACTLPSTFTEGRFGPPPEFKQDADSVQQRQKAYADAKETPGARARGRVGVFVPDKDGTWLFVPGTSWLPGEPVFLPPAKTASR